MTEITPTSEEQERVDASVELMTENSLINRKVAYASIASAIGSIVSILLSTVLINLSILSGISDEDKGTIKTSLSAIVTYTITLAVGYMVSPGPGDGVKEKK